MRLVGFAILPSGEGACGTKKLTPSCVLPMHCGLVRAASGGEPPYAALLAQAQAARTIHALSTAHHK